MPTDEQLNKLWELYTGYMGQMPSNVRSQLSTQPTSEVEGILSNTKTQIASDAVSKAQQNIALLSSGMPQGATSNYLQNIGKGWDTLSQMTGLKGVEEDAQKSAEFLSAVAQRGPMFEQTMQGGLQQISPTWLGATPEVVESHFSFIPNVRVRQQMVQNYLGAAKTSLNNTLKALNGLYQTAFVAAQTAAEADQDRYNKILDYTKSLWTEVAWVNREQYQQATAMESGGLGGISGGTGGTGGKSLFTQTQLNKGTAVANIPLSDFMRLDDDTKNFFINNATEINKIKKAIDQASVDGENPSDLEKEISESSMPDAVKDTLVRYLKEKYRGGFTPVSQLRGFGGELLFGENKEGGLSWEDF